jgi:hypothetical protein
VPIGTQYLILDVSLSDISKNIIAPDIKEKKAGFPNLYPALTSHDLPV